MSFDDLRQSLRQLVHTARRDQRKIHFVRKLWSAWTLGPWMDFALRFSWFALVRHREDGSFLVVLSDPRKEDTFEATGYSYIARFLTPWGAASHIKVEVYWDRLRTEVGPRRWASVFESLAKEVDEKGVE